MPDKNDQQKAPAEIIGEYEDSVQLRDTLTDLLRGYFGDTLPSDVEFTVIASAGADNHMVLSRMPAQQVEAMVEHLYRQLQDNREQQSAQERGRQGRLFH